MEMIEIFEINSKKGMQQFIEFPRKLYSGEPNYIAELNLTLKSKLSRQNPFLKHSDIALFMARDIKTNQILGRIAAIHNKAHIKKYNDNTGFFGFFDAVNSTEVSDQLFNKAGNWLIERGLTDLIGPTNPTTNDSSGVLVNGFDYPNQVSMPYNYAYYSELFKTNGLTRKIDLFAYHLADAPEFEKYSNILNRVEKKMESNDIRIRPMTARSFHNDLDLLNDAYNKFNEGNWGFIPLNREEFIHMAKELKSIMPYDLALIAEKGEEIIGYIIAVPDFNQVVKKVRNGKLFPFGILKILKYRNSIDSSRIMLVGIDPKYRGIGLDLILYKRITDALHKQNIFQCEAGYVMSTNEIMNSIMYKIGGNPIKQYSLFHKKLITNES